jgi:hypothetical protein
MCTDIGVPDKWDSRGLTETMCIYFQKIVPIDERFLLLVGGTIPTSQKKPSLLDLAYN